MSKYWLPRCTTEGSSWLLKVMKSGSLWRPGYNLMHASYGNQLQFTTWEVACDKWARFWWVRENKVSPASLAFIFTPLRFPHANTNTLTYFVSTHTKGILCKNNLLFTPNCVYVCVCLFGFHIVLILTLKSHKVAGLFGLSSNDTYAVL